jgi:hypothetical protein
MLSSFSLVTEAGSAEMPMVSGTSCSNEMRAFEVALENRDP